MNGFSYKKNKLVKIIKKGIRTYGFYGNNYFAEFFKCLCQKFT